MKTKSKSHFQAQSLSSVVFICT